MRRRSRVSPLRRRATSPRRERPGGDRCRGVGQMSLPVIRQFYAPSRSLSLDRQWSKRGKVRASWQHDTTGVYQLDRRQSQFAHNNRVFIRKLALGVGRGAPPRQRSDRRGHDSVIGRRLRCDSVLREDCHVGIARSGAHDLGDVPPGPAHDASHLLARDEQPTEPLPNRAAVVVAKLYLSG